MCSPALVCLTRTNASSSHMSLLSVDLCLLHHYIESVFSFWHTSFTSIWRRNVKKKILNGFERAYGYFVYSALVIDGIMIYMMQERSNVPQSSVVIHGFFLFFGCVFAKYHARKWQFILLISFPNVLHIGHSHCITEAGRLLRECTASRFHLAAPITLH